jgi:hypothetical protein
VPWIRSVGVGILGVPERVQSTREPPCRMYPYPI